MSRDLSAQLSRWRRDRMTFRRETITLEDGSAWGDRAEAWQIADFEALDSGQYRHAYLERPRGQAKTFDLGTEAVAELLLGSPGQRLYCAAADEDQARLLFEDVAGKFERNPVLRGSVKVTRSEIIVKATGSRLRVLSSDAPTAYGLRPDWIAIDEIPGWRRRKLWDSLWTATGKRPRCRLLSISTAGWDFTGIAWEVRQIAQSEPDWYFSSRGQCASWISPSWLEQQRRTLPSHVFARLHDDDLRRELLGLEVQETSAGWRVDHRAGKHDDHTIAVALAVDHLTETPADFSEILEANVRISDGRDATMRSLANTARIEHQAGLPWD